MNVININHSFVVSRTLCLTVPLDDSRLAAVLAPLKGMVDYVNRDACHLRLRYDASQLQLDAIISALQAKGAVVLGSGWQRVRLAWYRYVDANSYTNAHSGDLHCCNKPPRRPPH